MFALQNLSADSLDPQAFANLNALPPIPFGGCG